MNRIVRLLLELLAVLLVGLGVVPVGLYLRILAISSSRCTSSSVLPRASFRANGSTHFDSNFREVSRALRDAQVPLQAS